jgi:tRNA A-37 threonylcarbamoyl transferase component Bud32
MNGVFTDGQTGTRIASRRTDSFLGSRPRITRGSIRPIRLSAQFGPKRLHSNPGHQLTLELATKDYSTPRQPKPQLVVPQTVRNVRPFTAHNSNKPNLHTTHSNERYNLALNLPEDRRAFNFGPIVTKIYTPLHVRTNAPATKPESDALTDRGFSSISNYLIGKDLGKGAYAVVRHGIHKPSNRKVAIKIYEKSKFQEPNRLKNAYREVAILQKLDHPNIVKMHEFIETEDFLYLVLELISGCALNEYVKRRADRRLAENEAGRIFAQLVQALEYCHAHDVAHRDVKFDNILVDQQGNVKLIDFGFSTHYPASQRTKLFCGTPSYMAPEIVLKTEYLGQPVDMWACGVVLFGLLCGQFPFKSQTDKECYRKILAGTVYVPSFVPDEPREIIEGLLVAEAGKRMTAKEVLAKEWVRREVGWSEGKKDEEVEKALQMVGSI